MRLNRFLASCGLGSRRGCEELIRNGHVLVNGQTCTNLATRVGPDDTVEYGGRILQQAKRLTVAFHKPPGVICTRRDEAGRRTIYNLIPNELSHLHYVGRLDKDSEGLIILTNDGDLTEYLTHAANKVEKEYLVTTDRVFDPDDIPALLRGIETEEGTATAVHVEKIAPRGIDIILTQGLKRQVRLMLEALGYEVTRLVRIRVGGFDLGDIKPGKWQRLTDAGLLKLTGRSA